MSYGIYLSFNNQEEGFQIPINPESIEMSDGSKGNTYDVVGLGEINVIKDMKLTEYAFNGIFPAQRYAFVVTDYLLLPKRYVELILKWMGTKRPVRLVFTGDSFEINTPVSIESFNWKEVAGGSGDIEYSLKLRKYVFYSAKKVAVVRSSETGETNVIKKTAKTRPDDRHRPDLYTLVKGDTLWKVAKMQLGDGARWKELQTINNISDAQLKNLPVGMKIKLPKEVTGNV